MNIYQKYKTSFNRFPCHLPQTIERPESYSALEALHNTPGIARGLGCSYGDAALNQNGRIILTERLDRFLEFDETRGILCAEAGISLAKILAVIVPRGWFLPVTPGTMQVTLGGCVAADVHGKNHFVDGAFGQHVLSLTLATPTDPVVVCSPTEHPELFWATLGGMGLTGLIGTVTIQLKPIKSALMHVQTYTTDCLEKTIALFFDQDKNQSLEYQVAWLDGLSGSTIPGVFMCARHAILEDLSLAHQKTPLEIPSQATYTFPGFLPNGILHPTFVRAFNRYYYKQATKKTSPEILTYRNYFYPLDRLHAWPKLYGKRGFLQYQCVIPNEVAAPTIQTIFDILRKKHCPSYLAVLKRLGVESQAFLSFPRPGLTLAIDLPIRHPELFLCLDELDAVLIRAGGRVYLAKDARLKPEHFREMYPRYAQWLNVKRQWDPKLICSSSLSRRLLLTPQIV